MNINEINEGNRLIAEFIGWKNIGMKDLELWQRFPNDMGITTPQCKFHSDWNWLMSVVEKIIKEYRTDYYNEYDMCQPDLYSVTIGYDAKYSSQGLSKNSLIEATWLAVIELIKWYNTQKQ